MASAHNLLEGYITSDTDQVNTSPQYWGFINGKGSWYIMRQVINGDNTQSFRYSTGGGGSTNYATAWTGRAGLSYDYYSNVFSGL